MSDSTHVPDKLEGYMLQVRHALFELISVEDFVVSVEAYDDVAVEKDGLLIAQQIKSVSSSNNPVADKSEAFWKTIYNWCNYFEQERFSQKVILKYIVAATHSLKAGTIPNSFAEAKTEIDAAKALEDAEKSLFGEARTKSIGKTIQPYIDYCFAQENRKTVVKVISLMEIDIHEDTYDEELFEKFKRQIIPPEYAEELFDSMLGWVSEQIHQQTKQNKPAYINSKDYRTALMLQISYRDQTKILTAVSVQPEASKTTVEVMRHDTYIKQLELINEDKMRIFNAASDYLRTVSEKTAWAKKGLINKGGLDDYYDKLKRFWDEQKRQLKIVAKNEDEIEKGQYLYSKCSEDASKHRFLGRDVPSFFGSGTLQALANELSIGWHPRYIELLKEDDEGDK